MADTTIAITALVVGVLGALGACIRAIHLRKVKCCCINSDCLELFGNDLTIITIEANPKTTHSIRRPD